MKKYYVHSVNGAVIEVDTDDTSINIDANFMTEISEEAAKALQNPSLTEDEINTEALATFQTSVQTAIDKTDLVAIRCLKAGIEFPTEWREYTVALRALKASVVVAELPVMPSYPVGS